MQELDLAHEAYAQERYAEAEREYLEAMRESGVVSDPVVDRWLTCRGYSIIEDAKAVVRANPGSSSAYRLLIIVLQREREYQEAVRVATDALARFEDSWKLTTRFLHYRFDAALKGSRPRFTNWEQVRGDLSAIWGRYSQVANEGRGKAANSLQSSIIRQLLQAEGIPVELILDFATEIADAHAHRAKVLRAHAATLTLLCNPGGYRSDPAS